MRDKIAQQVLQQSGASAITEVETIQTLWSGYGHIYRYRLKRGGHRSVIIKHVQPPTAKHHPRGWISDLAHQRKINSYIIETNWYQKQSKLCNDSCRVPVCMATINESDQFILILEDLDAHGFAVRKQHANITDIQSCIGWLANFHAIFMGESVEGLWPIGTYWHLQTRPEELQALQDRELQAVATEIDELLADSPYQTIVHGDAKLANFCFSSNSNSVAAVDFQYVGGGCGMKDLAYFIGSCLSDSDCERYEQQLLDYYFQQLATALRRQNRVNDIAAIEQNWRSLYHVAWADFHRFLKGWSPGHWKINSYSERVTRAVVTQLTQSKT